MFPFFSSSDFSSSNKTVVGPIPFVAIKKCKGCKNCQCHKKEKKKSCSNPHCCCGTKPD